METPESNKGSIFACRTFCVLVFALCIALIPSTAAAADCQFVLGFKAFLDSWSPDTRKEFGECLENESPTATGAIQHTTKGYLVWDRELNQVYFVYIFTPTPVPTPTPEPTPTPQPHVIDSKFNAALQAMRQSGPLGEMWYDRVFRWKIDIVFDTEGLCFEGADACASGGANTVYV